MAGYRVNFTLMCKGCSFIRDWEGGGGHGTFSQEYSYKNTQDLTYISTHEISILWFQELQKTLYFSFVELSQCHNLVHILQIRNKKPHPHTLIVFKLNRISSPATDEVQLATSWCMNNAYHSYNCAWTRLIWWLSNSHEYFFMNGHITTFIINIQNYNFQYNTLWEKEKNLNGKLNFFWMKAT